MSDSTNTPDSTPESSDSTPEKPRMPAAIQLQLDVKKKIADVETGGKSARQRVVGAMAEVEMERRVGVLTAALQKRRDLDGDLKKIKPDNVFVDAEGNEVMSSYLKGSQQAMKKLRERRDKLDRLIDAVCLKPTPEAYDKLSKLK